MTYVERCLYDYKANVASVEAMTEEIADLKSVHAQSYEAHMVNGVSDPVSDVTARILSLENRIARTERKIKPVEKLREELSGNDIRYVHMREILKLKYIEHEGNDETQARMAVSPPTYWRRVRELLYIARKYFGEER